MSNKANCTIIVNSCDTYEDTWYPFFKLLSVNWENCSLPIVLNTDSKSFSYYGLDIKTFNLYKRENVDWSTRLIETLKRIDTEFILFLLDDFFIKDYVQNDKVSKILDLLDKDKSVGCCYLYPMKAIHTEKDNDFYFLDNAERFQERYKATSKIKFIRDFFKPYQKKDLIGLYVVNAQAAIWRKDVLLKTLRKHESAWDWEVFGTIRANKIKEKFISVVDDSYFSNIIPYDFDKGTGIISGVWVPRVVVPLFEKYNIQIDLNKRGVKAADWNYKSNKNIFKKMKTCFHTIKCLLHS